MKPPRRALLPIFLPSFLKTIVFSFLILSFGSADRLLANCGDGFLEAGEACDGSVLGLTTACSQIPGYKSGTLSCKADCSGYNVSGCVAGNTTTAASCSVSDIEARITAASDGDIVQIPTGQCTWLTSNPLNIPDKNITLIGIGPDKNSTVITYAGCTKIIDVSTTKPFRISNFTIETNCGGDGMIEVARPSQTSLGIRGWRIDNMRFTVTDPNPGNVSSYGHTIRLGLRNYGVIDHCDFWAAGPQAVTIYVYGTGDNEARQGDTDWSAPLSLGTADAVYIENSTFYFDSVLNMVNDSWFGGRMVLRLNSITNGGFQTHAAGHQATDRGGLSYEMYTNQMTAPKGTYSFMAPRSGTGVFFNNSVSGFGASDVIMDNSRDWDGSSSFGLCDGNASVDGNQDATGWPCLDQIGRGPGPIGNQPSEPLYVWNNGSVGAHVVNQSQQVGHIVSGRDYVVGTPKPGYVPYPYPHPIAALTAPQNVSAPAIMIHPQSQTIPAGQTVSFFVSASGGNLNYQWQKNTVNITGANSSMLRITNVSAANAGSYRCFVSNTAGSLNSASATLTVGAAPGDTTPPVRSGAQPTGTLPAGTTQTTLQLTTDETATCKYGTTSNQTYASMPNTFTNTNSTTHSTTLTGLTNGTAYTRYVRCQDAANNANTTNWSISFSVANPPGAPDTLPPTLTILQPSDGQVFSSPTIAVSGSASDPSGISQVRVNNSAATGTTNWSRVITLSPGVNTIDVVATDNSTNHNSASDSITVTYNGSGTGTQAAPPFINKFNPAKGESANITFVVNGTGHVKVTVYDRKGREIRTVKDEDSASGIAPWDGKNSDGSIVASGLYNVVIDAAGTKSTTKVVVVK